MKKLIALIMILGFMSCSLSAGDLPQEESVNTEASNSEERN
jgi:hypothetical protein